jgi:hypothetical protein
LFNFLKRKKVAPTQVAGSAPFVLSLKGELLSDPSGRASDVQLASGAKEVVGAGRWVVVQGKLLALTNESPTYQSSFEQIKKVVEFLANAGMDMSGDGKGVLILVYSGFNTNGQGFNANTYRAVVASDSIEYHPE